MVCAYFLFLSWFLKISERGRQWVGIGCRAEENEVDDQLKGHKVDHQMIYPSALFPLPHMHCGRHVIGSKEGKRTEKNKDGIKGTMQ